MTDITDRLRDQADSLKFAEQFDDESLAKPGLLRDRQTLWEAADEIERLRAQVVALQSSLEVGAKEKK